MKADFSLRDPERFARAGEGMISNHGEDAPADADGRTDSLGFSASDTAADIRQETCQPIRVRVDGRGLPSARPLQGRLSASNHQDDTQTLASERTLDCGYCAAGGVDRNLELIVLSDRVTGPTAACDHSHLEIGRS